MKINNIELDQYQMEAIKSDHDATVVIAGAGSGKTFTIQGKIKYLLELGFKEKEILCISFTNKSVNDLKEKIKSNVDIYTFHKLALNLLGKSKYMLVNNNYLDYIIDEYFKSYIYYDKKNTSLLKKMIYQNISIDKILKSNLYEELKYKIKNYIKLARSNDMCLVDFVKIYKENFFNNRIFIKLVMQIYGIYRRELESINKHDLDDLLIDARKIIYKLKLPYKYIIIDEAQDTSVIRLNLILEIIKYTKAKLMFVGDDYQSIYKFNGSKIDIFLSIKDYIKDTKYYYLKYTYRNSMELITVSTNFIMRNKKQLKKDIISNKRIPKPIKIVKSKNIYEIIKELNNPLVIGRTNKDIILLDYDNKLTIHKSKGLESENVILINSDNIPNIIKDDQVLKYLINKDEVLYAEERRLFYVALTRTKNNIYIMVNKKMSPFVKELIHYYKDYIEII